MQIFEYFCAQFCEINMKKMVFLAFVGLFCMCAYGQVDQIVGDWKTVDDKTGDSFSIVSIYAGNNGLYYGKISKMLVGQDLVCDLCEGADHNRPLEGLVIIRDMKAIDGELREGKVLDPESGKFYYGKIYLKDGKLVLRGSLDKRGFLGRNQTWVPAN